MVQDFIKDIPWNKIKIIGHEYDGSKINTKLDQYCCIEELLQIIEFNTPLSLALSYRKETLQLI